MSRSKRRAAAPVTLLCCHISLAKGLCLDLLQLGRVLGRTVLRSILQNTRGFSRSHRRRMETSNRQSFGVRASARSTALFLTAGRSATHQLRYMNDDKEHHEAT